MTEESKQLKRPLTAKQEAFARLIFKGAYQRDAYMEVYKPTYAQTSIDANASVLAKNKKVLAKIAELERQVDDGSVMTIRQREARLSKIAKEDNYLRYGIARQANIAAIAELNKMTPGAYEPVKVDMTEGLAELLSKLRNTRPQLQEGDNAIEQDEE